MLSLQAQRRTAQIGFFLLFVLAPPLNLLRFDLATGHAWFLGLPWRLGIDAFLAGHSTPLAAAGSLFLHLFLPLLLFIAAAGYVAWRWGRLYCGWLCPHFSVVESINHLMLRASGRHSLWQKQPVPPLAPDGRRQTPDRRWWLAVLPASLLVAFLWAVALLTYLVAPATVYGGLWHGTLGRGPSLFIGVATLVFTLEFLFARHLFCRFGCAFGLLQSLVWMGNRRGMVVGVDRPRLAECADCLHGEGSACDAVCPMRLKPRTIKRLMFACTQCGQCLSACATVQEPRGAQPILRWVQGQAAADNEAGFKAPRPPGKEH